MLNCRVFHCVICTVNNVLDVWVIVLCRLSQTVLLETSVKTGKVVMRDLADILFL